MKPRKYTLREMRARIDAEGMSYEEAIGILEDGEPHRLARLGILPEESEGAVEFLEELLDAEVAA